MSTEEVQSTWDRVCQKQRIPQESETNSYMTALGGIAGYNVGLTDFSNYNKPCLHGCPFPNSITGRI